MDGELEIKQGRCYRAKKPKQAGFGYFNDRQVLRVLSTMSGTQIQYDSPSVSNGRHYPTVSLDKFQKWAGEDVTDKLPKGDWQPWRPLLSAQGDANG